MRLKANIKQSYRNSPFDVFIEDMDRPDVLFKPYDIEGFRSWFKSDFLWIAKARAKSRMKKMYKANKFVAYAHEVILEDKE
jgi:hypothetical protein